MEDKKYWKLIRKLRKAFSNWYEDAEPPRDYPSTLPENIDLHTLKAVRKEMNRKFGQARSRVTGYDDSGDYQAMYVAIDKDMYNEVKKKTGAAAPTPENEGYGEMFWYYIDHLLEVHGGRSITDGLI